MPELKGHRQGGRSKRNRRNKQGLLGFSYPRSNNLSRQYFHYHSDLNSHFEFNYKLCIFLNELGSSRCHLNHSALSGLPVLIAFPYRQMLKFWWKTRFTCKNISSGSLNICNPYKHKLPLLWFKTENTNTVTYQRQTPMDIMCPFGIAHLHAAWQQFWSANALGYSNQ